MSSTGFGAAQMNQQPELTAQRELCEQLLGRVQQMQVVDGSKPETKRLGRGVDRLVRRLRMEGQRLANLDDGRVLEADVLKSSAVHSLAAFVGVLEKEQDVVDVLCSASTGGRREKVDVDIVSRGGSRWVKVKSTSPLKLHRAFLGQSGGGDKSCLEVAEALCAARDHVAKTRSSSVGEVEVAFVFTQGLSTKLAAALESIGVVVEGGPRVHISKAGVQTLPEEDSAPSQDFARAQPPAQSPSLESATLLNLDVSTLLCLISDASNGVETSNTDPSDPLARRLPQRALLSSLQPEQREAKMSAIRALEGLLSGRRLVVCASAWQGLEKAAASSATERARVQALKARVEITPDQVPARVASL
eukprot:CAMPEP_0114543128 /NCGR_PEP_ID=MMETSP0114-20121206/2193_1 /TAXON_ID=31324 /ORGANISM="Goniomonas sp, Strain m" /LENGTH=360 /DNA_ID=CAMNT_0001727451 /DNA_START=5 /DNA_END=1083 /DNA_ORIENTATION=-